MNVTKARTLAFRRLGAPLAAAAAFGGLLVAAPGPSLAALEEFENWSVGERERDDENGLDDLHRSFSPYADWRWRALSQGARTGMGCATTETWEVNLEAKLRRPIGSRSAFSYRYRQINELGESYTWNEFAADWRTPHGLWLGATYRPAFEKELHDAGLFLGWHRDSSRWLRLHLGFEDALNDFWDRRTRHIVDRERRLYRNVPLEWELTAAWQAEDVGALALRAVRSGPVERRHLPAPGDPDAPTRLRLDGWLVDADLLAHGLEPHAWGLRSRWKAADRDRFELTDDAASVLDFDLGRLRDFYLRPWGEIRLDPRWRLRGQAQARWASEEHRDEDGLHRIEIRHWGGLLTALWQALPNLEIEVGAAAERVRVDQEASPEQAFFTHGDRTETRTILALHFVWDGARLVLFETFEGNRESHQGFGFHDKGFAHLVIEF